MMFTFAKRKPTAQERAQERKEAAFRKKCWAIRDEIEALPHDPASFTLVPAIIAKAGKDAHDRYSIFRELDERPGHYGYGSGTHWHSRLRSCRNHPVHGPELFDAINGRVKGGAK